MELHLVPTYPDGAGGLGYLEVVHMSFLPLVVAISVLQAASLAEGIATGMITFEAIYPVLALTAVCLRPQALGLPGERAKRLHDFRRTLRRGVRQEMAWRVIVGYAGLAVSLGSANSVDVVRKMQRHPRACG